ncbi:MAG TPA: DUF5681 domain-containing protein [Candidatus Sulfotelmatobacter sp.]
MSLYRLATRITRKSQILGLVLPSVSGYTYAVPSKRKQLVEAVVTASRKKKRPRGRHDHAAWEAQKFKPGHSGNPGGRHKIFQTFEAMVRQRLMQPCPTLVMQQLGLRRGATLYDAVVAAQVLNAANGDDQSFMNLHDIIEGRLPQKNFNLTVAAETFLQDAGFRQFLAQQHGVYLGQDTGSIVGEAIPALPAAETDQEP